MTTSHAVCFHTALTGAASHVPTDPGIACHHEAQLAHQRGMHALTVALRAILVLPFTGSWRRWGVQTTAQQSKPQHSTISSPAHSTLRPAVVHVKASHTVPRGPILRSGTVLRLWLQQSEREKPPCGEMPQHAPTQTPCNQPAIASVTHVQTQHTLTAQPAQPLTAPHTHVPS